MKILISGGAGFIGSHLCDYLLKKGHQVICLDNLLTGKKENIIHLLKNKNFKFIKQDITERFSLPGKIDAVCHLASAASPKDYLKFPLETLKAGSIGTLNLLELARKKRAIFLLASTSEVYGDPKVSPQKENYWGNVNPIGPRSCYSDDTGILTQRGWVKLSELKDGDLVMTLNKNKQMELQRPTEMIKQNYCGELIKFKNYQVDLLVTPNHKMYVKLRDDKKRNEFKLIPAFESINWSRADMLKSGDWKGREENWFTFPKTVSKNYKKEAIKKVKMDDWLEFMGYFLSEGCVHIYRKKQVINNKTYYSNIYNILIAQDKKNIKSREKIEKCLNKLPFKYFKSDHHQYRIVDKQLGEHLKQFGKSYEKFIPREFLNLSKRQLKILFDALMLGDGNKDGTRYYSNSYKLISDVQEIIIKLGLSGNIAVHDKRKKRPLCQIHLLTKNRKDWLTPTYPKRQIEQYRGCVYCVNVPNHIILIRRNGKPLFCGNCYDEAKRFSEALTIAYHRKHSLEIRIARIFNTYGPRMKGKDGRAIPTFISQALKNEDLTVFGKGTQTRSFCYISDLIEGIYRLLKSKINEPVNLGNPSEMKIIDLAKKIIALSRSKSSLIYKPLPLDDPRRRCPDIKRARELLGWQPKVNLEEGLKRTITWFKKRGIKKGKKTIKGIRERKTLPLQL